MPLDCVSRHRVMVMDRGGVRPLREVKDLYEVDWNRVRDDISVSTVKLNALSCSRQESFLSTIEPGRHELVIFRGDERVWEGPIVRAQYTRSGLGLYAHDVMHYAYRTVMHAGYSNAYPNVTLGTTRAETILRAELARKEAIDPPINVLKYLTVHHFAGEAKTSRVTLPYSQTVWEQVDDMAAKGGIDYTVVGRAIHLWDTSNPLGKTQAVTENDFLGDLSVSSYGMDLVTRAIVTDGQGHYGIAGGVDPYYGEVEVLATPYNETNENAATPTSAEMASQAQRNLSGNNPTPVQVRIPDGSSLNPNGVLGMSDLVPGVYVPLRATLTARKLTQMQKIQEVRVKETAREETVGLTLFPASDPDVVEP